MAPVDEMMKALRFHPDTKEFSLDEIPVPKLNEEDNVLVKVAAAGFCGTDLHIMAVNIIEYVLVRLRCILLIWKISIQ